MEFVSCFPAFLQDFSTLFLAKTLEIWKKSWRNLGPKSKEILEKSKKKKEGSQQHPVFPGGHPSKYWLDSTLLNFSDRTRTGVFNVIWPLASERAKSSLFQSLVVLFRKWKRKVWDLSRVSGKIKVGFNQQHPVFPGGHPSKYWLDSTLLNFGDRTRTGVFNVIWPLAFGGLNLILFVLLL